jgi:ankyrin repeat protein
MAASSLRAKVKATEPLYSNESEQVHLAGQLLIHLATQNTFGGKRQLFPKGRDLLEESFSVDTGSECFRSYHIQAIRTALENENLQLTEILLAKDSTGDLLREELDLLPIAISGGDSEIELAATENTKFESKWECRRKRDASHISNIVHQLISHGAPLNELDSKGRSPLWFACFSGLPQTFDLLVTSGANIQTLHDPVSKAPLDGHDLVNTSSATKVNLLRIALDSRFNLEGFDHGCEPWMYDFNGGDELINLRKTLKTFDHIIFSLLDAGLTCPTSDPSLIKLFHQSCFEGNMSHVKSLLHYGVDVNAVDNRACQDRYGTALHTAAARGYKEIVSLLLLNSANPKVKRRVGPTIWACDSDIMSRKSLRVPMTAIHYALYNAEKVPIFQAYHRLDSILQCCEAILHVGASNRDGEMLLIEAIVTGRTTLTQRLLQRGIRKAYVFTLDLRCIERYLQAGISFDYRAYQMWVISFAKSHPFTMESRNLAPVLDLLVQKSKPLLPKEIIGEIAASMFRHKDVLHHLIKNYNIDVNTLFQVNHDYDDALHEKFPLRDLPTSKEAIPFNLLQKACSEITDENAGDLHDAIQLLLEQGASVDCFGLPKTAFEYLRETIQHLKATEKSFQYRTGMKSFELTIARILRLLLVADTNQKSTLQSSIASSLAESTYPEKATWQPLSKLLQFDQPLLDRSRVLYQGKFNTNTHVDTGIDDALHNAGLLSDIRGSRTLGVDSPFKHLDTHLNSTIHGPTRFEYQPLRGLQSIRLIALEPAESFEAPVRCQIYQTNLATARSFEALSYVWGKVTNLVPIALNGHVTDITQSLWCILCRLRNNSALRVLWIDALCINQEDIREKSHQVQMMREIYITAERVLVWLGEADIESHRVLQTVAAGSETREHFESMGDSKLSSNPDRIPDCAVASALHTIYCRPW